MLLLVNGGTSLYHFRTRSPLAMILKKMTILAVFQKFPKMISTLQIRKAASY